jgi:O-acetyl-ADP-ribose deacetylase (regulator of RNase III)
MKIEICIRDKEQYKQALPMFVDCPDITVTQNTITNGSYSTLISAGNSFGQMDGGVDKIINTYLSSYTPHKYIHEDVIAAIGQHFAGELPVGQSIWIPTESPRHTKLIYTPTMRIAEDVSHTLNAYLAFRSALLVMQQANIQEASTPLFCTGAGCMSVTKACKQMKEAYNTVIKQTLIGGDWNTFRQHHRYLQSM